jgi:hypothetical protein
MASIFIEPTSSEGWTIAQHHTAEIIGPVIRSYLAAQMRKQAACDRFYDAQKAVTRVRHIDPAAWQAAVRIPVMASLGFEFEGPDADRQTSALYHLLGAATCLNWSFPAARVDSPAVTNGIDRETRQLVEYLVTLGVQEHDLPSLLELCKRL